MKSFTAFSRRLMLSLLVAFWTTSLIYATWRFIIDEENLRPTGLDDLSLPLLTRHCNHHVLCVIEALLTVVTITLALVEVRCNRLEPSAITLPPPQH